MTKPRLIVAAAIFSLAGGCASHSHLTTPPGATTQPVAQQPVDPKALLTLDQIQPVPIAMAAPTNLSPPLPPVDALILYAKARVAEQTNQRYAAINLLEEAAGLDPASFELQSSLARLYLTVSASGEGAGRALEKAAALNPDDLETQTDLGRLYINRGELPKATQHLRLAIQTTGYRSDDDVAPIADYYLAQSLEKQGYDRAALDEYTRLLERLANAPSSVRADPELSYWLSRPDLLYAEVARLHEKQGQPEDALHAYQLVAERNPDDIDTRIRIVHLLTVLGRRDEAAPMRPIRSSAHMPAQHRSRCCVMPIKVMMPARSARFANSSHSIRRIIPFCSRWRTCCRTPAGRLKATDALAKVSSTTRDVNGAGETEVVRKLFDLYLAQGKTTDAAKLLVETSATRPDAIAELLPMWIDVTNPVRRGRLRDSQLESLSVSKDAEVAKIILDRPAHTGRPVLLQHSLTIRCGTIRRSRRRFGLPFCESSSSDAAPADRQKQIDAIVADVRQRGDEGLAEELLGMALLANANSARTAGDNASSLEVASAASSAFEKAQKLGNHSPDLRLEYAQVQLLQQNFNDYEKILWKLISDRPGDERAYTELFHYDEQRGQPERGVAVSQAWLLADPQSPSARLLRVLLLSVRV